MPSTKPNRYQRNTKPKPHDLPNPPHIPRLLVGYDEFRDPVGVGVTIFMRTIFPTFTSNWNVAAQLVCAILKATTGRHTKELSSLPHGMFWPTSSRTSLSAVALDCAVRR
jgi:hypothetical protein